MASWDTTVALAFAAEELLFAAQAVTSDLTPQEQRFASAHDRVRTLSDNGNALPSHIADRLAALDTSYTDRERSGATDTVGATAIVGATLNLLGDVETLLREAQRKQP